MSAVTPGAESFEYTPLPERIRDIPAPDERAATIIAQRINELGEIAGRDPDFDGATE